MTEVCYPPDFSTDNGSLKSEFFDPNPAPIEGSFNPFVDGVDLRFHVEGRHCRPMPAFAFDRRRASSKKIDSTAETEIEGCSKRFDGKNGGLFGWHCGECRHCIGFTIMKVAEGRRDALAGMIRCMPHAPENLIYDYVCATEEACLNRLPHFFSETSFYIDRIHQLSHLKTLSCSPTFRMDLVAELDKINSEVAEQFHNRFDTFAKYASQMSLALFMLQTRHMIDIDNFLNYARIAWKAYLAHQLARSQPVPDLPD